MARKSWDQLSPAYRRRLERTGYTRSDYAANKPRQVARGHATTPEHKGRPLSSTQKARLSKGGQKGRGKPERPFGPITKERHQKDIRNARERAKRYAAKPQTKREAEWKDTETTEFWKLYREMMGV